MTQGNPSGAGRPAQYKMKVEKGITVTMRDGVRISLCVYRPDAPGEFPALFAASPYQYEMDEVPAYPLFLWRETGPVEWYVGQGYAYVHADVRGAGRSEGEFEFMVNLAGECYDLTVTDIQGKTVLLGDKGYVGGR